MWKSGNRLRGYYPLSTAPWLAPCGLAFRLQTSRFISRKGAAYPQRFGHVSCEVESSLEESHELCIEHTSGLLDEVMQSRENGKS